MNWERIIAIGDIHGEFELLKELVENVIVFNPERDKLIFLGDYIDRSRKSREVVEYLAALKQEHPESCVLLKGNHEDFVSMYLAETGKTKNNVYSSWMYNGGTTTISSFGDMIEFLYHFVKALPLFHEEEVNGQKFVFTHAGIPIGKTVHTATKDELLWGRSFDYDGDGISVIGHSVHKDVTKFPRFVGKPTKVVDVDTGACFYGKLSGYDIIEDVIYEATL